MGWFSSRPRVPTLSERFPEGMMVRHKLAPGQRMIVSGYEYTYMGEGYYHATALKVRGADLELRIMSPEEVEPWP